MKKKIIINVFVTFIVVMTAIVAYHKYFALKVYSLDLRGFISEQQRMLMDGKLDKEGMEKKFDRLDQIIKEKGSNVVVLTSEIVIKGDKIEVD